MTTYAWKCGPSHDDDLEGQGEAVSPRKHGSGKCESAGRGWLVYLARPTMQLGGSPKAKPKLRWMTGVIKTGTSDAPNADTALAPAPIEAVLLEELARDDQALDLRSSLVWACTSFASHISFSTGIP